MNLPECIIEDCDPDVSAIFRTLELAREAVAFGEVPVGALVVRNGRVVSQAFNLKETLNDPTAHAERIALTLAGRALGSWRLTGCCLFVSLEPCIMCAAAIVQSRVDRVVFGAYDTKAGGCESIYRITSDLRLNHRPQVRGGVQRDACTNLLREFFQDRRDVSSI